MSNTLYPEIRIEFVDMPEFCSKGLKITKIITCEELDDLGIKGVINGVAESVKKYAEDLK